VHITDQVGHGSEFEAFDERAAFSDGFLEFKPGDEWEFSGNALHDAEGVVAAAIENDDQLKLPVVILFKITGVIPENRFNTVLFVIRRDQQQHARTAHGLSISRFGMMTPRGKRVFGRAAVAAASAGGVPPPVS